MKLGVYRVYWHRITKKNNGQGVLVEVSRTSPEMSIVAAEHVGLLLDSLPKPPSRPEFIVENHIVQIDQKHKEVIYEPQAKP